MQLHDELVQQGTHASGTWLWKLRSQHPWRVSEAERVVRDTRTRCAHVAYSFDMLQETLQVRLCNRFVKHFNLPSAPLDLDACGGVGADNVTRVRPVQGHVRVGVTVHVLAGEIVIKGAMKDVQLGVQRAVTGPAHQAVTVVVVIGDLAIHPTMLDAQRAATETAHLAATLVVI